MIVSQISQKSVDCCIFSKFLDQRFFTHGLETVHHLKNLNMRAKLWLIHCLFYLLFIYLFFVDFRFIKFILVLYLCETSKLYLQQTGLVLILIQVEKMTSRLIELLIRRFRFWNKNTILQWNPLILSRSGCSGRWENQLCRLPLLCLALDYLGILRNRLVRYLRLDSGIDCPRQVSYLGE